MQRYRVNYRLLAILAGSGVVLAPALFLLWSFQVNRNASKLLDQSAHAEEKGEQIESFDSLNQYVKLRNREVAGHVRLAKTGIEAFENKETKPEDRERIYMAVVDSVLRTARDNAEWPEAESEKEKLRAELRDARRKLVEMHMTYGYFDRAATLVDELIKEGHDDHELYSLKATCLQITQNWGELVKWCNAAIGFNLQTKEFDKPALAADQPLIYRLLAAHHYGNNERELADRVIEQMVSKNKDNLQARILQYQYLRMTQKPEEAREALAAAFALDATDADVLDAMGQQEIADYETALRESTAEGADAEALKAQADKHLEAAMGYYSQGLEKYPDQIGFYQQLSRLEQFRRNFDEAIAIIDRGLEQFDMETVTGMLGLPVAIELFNQKLDILFTQNDVAAVEKELATLRELNNPRVEPLIEYFEARIDMQNQDFRGAARRFNDVKTRMVGMQNLQALASFFQALCHQELNQADLALEAARWAVEQNGQLAPAQALVQQIMDKEGMQRPDDVPSLDDEIRQHAQLPPEQQDWDALDERMEQFIREQAERLRRDQTWIDVRMELLRAQVFVTRADFITEPAAKKQMYVGAWEALQKAYKLDPADISVQLYMPRVVMLEAGSGPAKALQLLDRIIADNEKRGVEETMPFRLLRVDLLFALRDEQVTNQLRAATEGMDAWTPAQQAEVHAAVAAKFQQLNQPEDAELAFKEAIRLAPTLLQYRLALFELARLKADDAAMQDAQRGVLEIVKSEADTDYILTEVKRLLINFASEQITADQLKRARTLLNDAIARRSNWAEAYIISAQLAIALEKDRALALQNLNLALEHGPTNLVALNLQIRLLADQGQFAAARKVMDRVPEVHWAALLDRVAAVVLQGVGENDAAFREAQKVADANPNDPRTQIWFAGVATTAEKFDAAEAAYKAAIANEPTNPDSWSALLNYYMLRKQAPEVEATLRQAQLSLDEEYTTLLTAQQHRLFGRYPQAESIFLSSYRDQLDDVNVAQRLADFYLTWGEYDRAQRDKAAPYLNRILRAGNEGKAPKNDPTVAWARRQAARLFSLSGDYQDSLRAEQLLARSVAEGDATNEGEDMLVDILNRRGDPASRLRAITLLEQIKEKRGLQPNYELLLGEALAGVGDWSAADRHMQAAIARYPNDVALRVGLIEMYLNRKDTTRAESWLARLAGVPEGNKAIPQLRIRLAATKGDKDEVRKQLVALTPNLQAPNDETLGLAYSVAMLAEAVGDHEYALQLISFVAQRQPGHELELTQFMALYGPVDDGIRVLQQYFDQSKDDVLGQAIGMLRSRRKEAPEKLDEFVNQLVRLARRDDVDSARRMVAEAESFEIQEKYDDAIAAYNRLLARDDVPRFVRASALNNLSFLLAMQKRDLDQALAGVNEAMEILGPISDVLDTRALVYLHNGEPQKAVEDLQLAVKMNATASKYFHLAEALLAVNDRAAALEAWKEAEERGISIETTPVVEQDDLRQFMEKIGASAVAAN